MNFHSVPQELTECDREAIHHIAAVQGFGALIAHDAKGVITHRSANCAQMLGSKEPLDTGRPLAEYFSQSAVSALQTALGKINEDDAVERLFGLDLTGTGSLYDCAVHASGHTIIVEFEPHAANEFRDHLAAVPSLIAKLSASTNADALCDLAACLVREMLGYDRVMIYRFHRDDSGEVVAEDRRHDLEPYLGLRYPKTDIPQQARQLFLRNRFRIIADMDKQPVPIEPAPGDKTEPLDLSMSVLRAHSQVHVQYMKNMGVEASLAISIVRQGKLWGMISCHHTSPKVVPYSLRSVAEMMSHMFSMTLDRLLVERSEGLRARSQDLHAMLMRRLAEGASFADDLDMFAPALRDLIAHDGLSVLIHDEYHSFGESPDRDEFLTLLPGLNQLPESQLLATSALSEHIREAADLSSTVTGALVLPVSRVPHNYLVLWRKPLTQTVRWAGDPAKAKADSEGRLEPRSSFAAWVETITGRSEEWDDSDLTIADYLRNTVLEVVLKMTDEVASERKRAREQQDLLIAELNHRVRNILNLIRSLVSQSTKDAANIADFTSNIDGRIAALATAHDNITRQNWAAAPLASLFESEIEAYLSSKKDRLRITGEPVMIKPEAYTVLALVVHELVTNSAKYGSLCDSRGTIDIEVARAGNGDLLVSWRERGGPPVKQPTRRGFGTTIITRIIPHDLRGDAELNFKLSGLEAEFRIPARHISVETEMEATTSGENNADAQGDKPDRGWSVPEHVLLVEDNMIIALDTEDCLRDAGVKSVSVESTVSGALAAIEKREPDFAVVDFNLGSESSAKIAEELSRRGVRFVLATGYSELGQDLEGIGADGLIRKPYGKEEIERALAGEPVS